MKLKKASAVLSLLSVLTMLVHIGYSVFCYLTMYYNPQLKTLTSVPFLVCVCLHAVLGMCSVFLQTDGTRQERLDRQTVIQRVSAALIFPLLIVHMKTFDLLHSSAASGNWLMFALLIFTQALFYAVVCAHAGGAFSKALIILGLLKEGKGVKTVDRISWIFFAAVFAIAVFAVTRGELLMFLPH